MRSRAAASGDNLTPVNAFASTASATDRPAPWPAYVGDLLLREPTAADLEHSRYIFPGEVPGALVADIEAVQSPAGAAERMTHRMLAQDPIEVPGGTVRITDSKNFPSASTIAAAWVELQPGALREMHWHSNND